MTALPELAPTRDASASLPSPEGWPSADVVVYDGNCQFCQRQVARLHRWDGGNRLAFLSLHDPRTRELCPNLSHEQLMDQMYVLDGEGRQYGGAAAIRYLSRRLPRLWPISPLLHLPFSMPVWRWLYRQVAVRRYLWNRPQPDDCADGACRVHFKK